jgi:hypothetical protein
VAYILITAKWNWVPLTEGRLISHMSTIFGHHLLPRGKWTKLGMVTWRDLIQQPG